MLSRLPIDAPAEAKLLDKGLPCFTTNTYQPSSPESSRSVTSSARDQSEDKEFFDEFTDDMDCFIALVDETRYQADPPSQISLDELIRNQQTDDFFELQREEINAGKESIFVDDESVGLLMRPTNSRDQIGVPKSLQPRLLHLSHSTMPAGHARGRRMYTSLSDKYYWPAIAMDVYETVRNCSTCAKERV